jgi:hypothetical protein
MHRFWSLVALTVLVVAGQPAARGYRETGLDRPARTTRVGFDLYRDYLIVVRGSVGPLKGLNFLLDTGATPSVLDPRVAGKLHLEISPTGIAVLNGSVQGGEATVPSLQFGPIRKENLPVLVEDLSFLQNAVPVRIDGIVGLDVLGQSAFVIDYPSREIRFGSSPSMRDSIPLQMKGGLAIVDAMVNHAPVHLLLDTGASSLIIFEEAQNPALAGNAGEAQPTSRTIGDFERKQLRSISLSLGKAEFGHEPAFMVHNRRDAGHDFDGLISPAALGITSLAVDLARGEVAFTRDR